jgi:hypothetical protein
MSVHSKAIKELAPADYLIIEKEHAQLEKFLIELRNACACSNLDKLPECNPCEHEQQTSCQGRLPSFLFYVIDLAADHFDHEEAIMLSRPHATEQHEYIHIHQQAHIAIMQELNALIDKYFSLSDTNSTAEIYTQFYKNLSDLFEEHDRSFDGPFILSTKN